MPKTLKPQSQAVELSPEMTTVLLWELVIAIRAGKRSDNCFKIEVWNAIAQTVQTVSASKITLTGEKCQTRLETLRRKWSIWLGLKNLSDFRCDLITGIVTAPDQVCEMEIQKQPGIREFHDRPMGNATEMTEVFEGTQVTCHHAIYPKFSLPLLHSIESLASQESLIDSDSDQDSSSNNLLKKRMLARDGSIHPPFGPINKHQENQVLGKSCHTSC